MRIEKALKLSLLNYACDICGKMRKWMHKYHELWKKYFNWKLREELSRKLELCSRWKKVKNNGKKYIYKVSLWERLCCPCVGRNRFWYHNFYYFFKRKWKPLTIRKESSSIKEVYFMLLSFILLKSLSVSLSHSLFFFKKVNKKHVTLFIESSLLLFWYFSSCF